MKQNKHKNLLFSGRRFVVDTINSDIDNSIICITNIKLH